MRPMTLLLSVTHKWRMPSVTNVLCTRVADISFRTVSGAEFMNGLHHHHQYFCYSQKYRLAHPENNPIVLLKKITFRIKGSTKNVYLILKLHCFNDTVCMSTVWLSNHRQHGVLSKDSSVHSPMYGKWCCASPYIHQSVSTGRTCVLGSVCFHPNEQHLIGYRNRTSASTLRHVLEMRVLRHLYWTRHQALYGGFEWLQV